MPVREIAADAPPERRAGQTRRERQRRETRERIFQVALDEFRGVGFGAAQIERIALRAGVSRGTFYFHFPTREDVLVELQRRGEREIVERIEARDPPPASLSEFLLCVLDAILASLGGDAALRREIMAMYVRGVNVRPELGAEPLVVALVDRLAEAAEQGSVRDDISPEQLAILFLGSLLVHLMGDGDSQQRREGAQLAIEVFLRGIAP